MRNATPPAISPPPNSPSFCSTSRGRVALLAASRRARATRQAVRPAPPCGMEARSSSSSEHAEGRRATRLLRWRSSAPRRPCHFETPCVGTAESAVVAFVTRRSRRSFVLHPPTGSSVSAANAESVAELMPRLKDDLARLVAIPSISAAGYPETTRPPLLAAYEDVIELFRDAGVQNLGSLDLPDTAPVVTGEIPAPRGRADRTALQPLRRRARRGRGEWESPPFEAVERDGAIYGRGSADTKANILVHVGALRAWDGKPPVGIKIVIEGQEEVGGALHDLSRRARRSVFAADAMVIGGHGQRAAGRADADGGAARHGDGDRGGRDAGGREAHRPVRRRRARRVDRAAARARVAARRRTATSPWRACGARSGRRLLQRRRVPRAGGGRDGMPFFGTGGLGARVWSGPAITVTGIDVLPVDKARSTPSSPYARAKINLRVHPEQDAGGGAGGARGTSSAQRPFGIELEVSTGETGKGSPRAPPARRYEAARAAMVNAWGVEPVSRGGGGSIPLVNALQEAAPDAEILLLGDDGRLRQHPRARTSACWSTNWRRPWWPRPRSSASGGALAGDMTVPPAPRRRTRGCSGCWTGSSGSGTRCPTRRSCSSGCAGRDRAVAAARVVGHQGDVHGHRAAARPAEETYYGGSTDPSTSGRRCTSRPRRTRSGRDERVEGLLTVDGVRFLFTSFVSTSGTSRR